MSGDRLELHICGLPPQELLVLVAAEYGVYSYSSRASCCRLLVCAPNGSGISRRRDLTLHFVSLRLPADLGRLDTVVSPNPAGHTHPGPLADPVSIDRLVKANCHMTDPPRLFDCGVILADPLTTN